MPLSLLPTIDEPLDGERPAVYSDRIGRAYSIVRTAAHKKKLGQFMTPVAAADFMSSFVECDRDEVWILDPGAGSGTLACAIAEALARRERPPRHVRVDVYECDADLVPVLERTLGYLVAYLARAGVRSDFRIFSEDFVLKNAQRLWRSESLFREAGDGREYDVIIGNPPYFKLAKSDARAKAAEHIVHGQPNIYAMFMSISAALLKRNGELVFITPRSFTSGPYFRRFREDFFGRVRPEALHVFDSRKDAFNRDGVLQENLILKGRRDDGWARDDGHTARVTVSCGLGDLESCTGRIVLLWNLLDMTSKEKMLRIPSSIDEERVIAQVDRWRSTPNSYGIQVSTGPVVPFRATELLSRGGNVPGDHAPLLWLQNIRSMRVEWPTSARNKPQYISAGSQQAAPLLVRDRNYVLLRRFSAKEERRRLVAAPLLAGQLGAEWIGIENHVNYIHRPGGSLTEEEAFGLAAIYNSGFMDIYFRVLNGSTQVSATEIRRIPLPPLDIIIEIGRRARKGDLNDLEIERIAQIDSASQPECREEVVTHG